MKKILSVVLILLFVAQIFSGTVFAANESGSPKHIPRIVSVVFDDSGSMYKDTDRWAYTSYAMQAFVAMMGDKDVLYVTYLNAPAGTVKINLSNSAKQGNIENIEKTMFGGGTPNKLQNGAECLKEEYSNYGNNAKYYLVVLADGLLDAGQGDMAEGLKNVSSSTAAALSGADFETIYFSMLEKANLNISGVTSHNATTGDQIVNVLRDISADIMGRTKIDHSVSGGKLSFELDFSANKSIYTADLMITDWSGVAPEFCFATERPAIFVNTKIKCLNPNWENLGMVPVEISLRDQIGVSIDKDKLDNLAQTVEELLNKDYSTTIRDIFNGFIYNHGHAGEIGAKYILKSLSAKQKK